MARTRTPDAFVCDGCGPLDHVLMDGYGFGDRALEGVMFRVFVGEDGALAIEPVDGWEDRYLVTLNRDHYGREGLVYAQENDVAECPKCHEDVDAQPVKAKGD